MIPLARKAWAAHKADALVAYDIFVGHCGSAPIRVPGMDTALRLAIRIECGRSVEEAAAREYVYRWHLALRSRVFGIPHAIGL